MCEDNPKNEEVEALYSRLEEETEKRRAAEEELAVYRKMFLEHPDDGAFKPCGNSECPNKVQVGTRYCPPCRTWRWS